MIVLFTDFGWQGPYVGQMKAKILHQNPDAIILDLMHDAPIYKPRYAAYLLNVLVKEFPLGTVFLCVVDPGVGADERRPVVVKVDGRWFVGPDNGLLNLVALTANELRWWDISWRPPNLSNTFHGRDLFAPVAADLALGIFPESVEISPQQRVDSSWALDLREVIYQDHYGNCMTGMRAGILDRGQRLQVAGETVAFARTFAEAREGELFWYENSIGLLEFAVREGDAAARVRIGDLVTVCMPDVATDLKN